MNWNNIRHFNQNTDKMLPCPCCGAMNINKQAIKMLDKARIIAEIPFIITSCCRCVYHNSEVGGVDSSSHVCGSMEECYAFDIACDNSRQRFIIIDALIKAGFNRIGIAKTFIHIDCDPDKVDEVIWLY